MQIFWVATHRVFILSVALISAACATGGRLSSQKFQTQEISFRSSLDGVTLHGALASPPIQRRGVVLLLVGSGKVDRDETVPADMTFSGKTEKLFAQLSQTLVNNGFVTFRYDKRGVLGPDGSVDLEIWKTADRSHLISDAVDAATLLIKTEKINADQLVILGHSEGTIIATEVAVALGGKVKALLLFGAQARSMKDMLRYQIVEPRTPRGSGVEGFASNEGEYRQALEMIKNSKEVFAPDGKPMEWYRQYLASPTNADRLRHVTAKKFIFQGIEDPQTPIDEIDYFVKRGVQDMTVFQYPGLGHGFSQDRDGKPTLGPIDSQVLHDLAECAKKL